MIKKIVITLLALATTFLIGCSHFTTSTNVDKSNFTRYFASSNVKVFNAESEFTQGYKYIGLVEGDDCQQKQHHAKPDESIARTNARKHANKLNANAVIFTGCALIENDQSSKYCISSTVCYGKAYVIETN